MEHIRHHRCAVRSYIFARPSVENLVVEVLGGEVLEKHPTQNGHHMSVAIQDAVIVIESGPSFPVPANTSYVYVYVPDVDATYNRALAQGCTSFAEPEDKPYQERQCGIRDEFGNIWWISTFKS